MSSPKLERLPAASRPLTRKATRKTASGAVLVQTARGEQDVAQLRDVSEYGCNIACEANWLRSGSFITLRIGHDHTIQAIIRWVRDGTAGIEFLRAISLADSESFSSLAG